MSTPAVSTDFSAPWGLVSPAPRFLIEQTWWLAAELVRRHPDHVIYEMHPGGGLGDVLMVRPSRDLREGDARIMINRGGTIRVVFHRNDNSLDQIDVCHSAEALAEQNPHTLVKKMEAAARLASLGQAPASTPRSLAFRLASVALTSLLNDRNSWDWRQVFHDASGDDPPVLPYLRGFPGARAEAREVSLEPWDWGHPESHYWAVLRDEEPLALVSAEGSLHFPDARVDLSDAYASRGRNMHRVVGDFILARLH